MKKQVFKGLNLSRTQVKNRIVKVWNETIESDKHGWYNEAHYFALTLAVTKYYGAQSSLTNELNKACGVIAALSPVKEWNQNKKCAINAYEDKPIGHIKQFEKKALAIMECGGSEEEIVSILNGRKITAFFLNIRFPNRIEMVTIDRHALSVALGVWVSDETYAGMTANQYEFFSDCYKWAAVQLNVSPVLLQSATWLTFRKNKHNYEKG